MNMVLNQDDCRFVWQSCNAIKAASEETAGGGPLRVLVRDPAVKWVSEGWVKLLHEWVPETLDMAVSDLMMADVRLRISYVSFRNYL